MALLVNVPFLVAIRPPESGGKRRKKGREGSVGWKERERKKREGKKREGKKRAGKQRKGKKEGRSRYDRQSQVGREWRKEGSGVKEVYPKLAISKEGE